jgi:hypothetical protein
MRAAPGERATSHRIQDEPANHPNFCVEFDNDVAFRRPTRGTDFLGRMPDLKVDLVGLWLGRAKSFHFTLLRISLVISESRASLAAPQVRFFGADLR